MSEHTAHFNEALKLIRSLDIANRSQRVWSWISLRYLVC
ncbi:hypothetical protein HAT2_00655 [Candidatus Similichlamydia laticola]|uniref:Uncharacterized protein n=1 Tax=Candidatus Similichlamydia laticola TaxID=2170265 RepID=A0A369KCB8_9BACT|nr:hypothetical protein HAT2_00655 [Candidatus Similichlamydia laticola]